MDPHKDPAASIRLGEFEIDRASRALRRRGRLVPLGARALDVLWTLVEAGGRLVTKEELLRQAWPGLVVEEANVQVQVSALRKVLGAEVIATVPSLGYRLAVPISEGGARPARHNLAAERTPFVGRTAVLSEAQAGLAHGVLLTFIGIGGSGKTRLARRLAEQQLARFDDGVWWIDLAPLDRAEQLAPAVAQTLGCRLDGTAAPLEALTHALRPQRILLVLDNCEHLLEAVCALLDPLLEAAPGLRVVATSREALGLRGEMILPVKPLDLPPQGATPEEVWTSDAGRLFLQAAQLSSPHLPLGDDAASTVAAICRQLDGIPLALELAATQLQVLAPEQLLEVLQQRFRLALGARRSLPRQQTLHAVIRWSVENLGEHERDVLAALAACAGGCDLAAVQALLRPGAGGDGVIASLSRLADRSLLVVKHGAGKARYHLLETVRQYVLEALLTERDEAALQDRHCQHYLGIAEALRPQLRQATRERALAQLDLERDNMGRAIDWAVQQRQWAIGARFVRALLAHWAARAWHVPGLEIAQAVLDVTVADEDPVRASVLMLDAASLELRVGRVEEARRLAQRAMLEAQHAGSLEHEIEALVMRMFCDLREGDPATLVPDLEAMLERTVRAGLTLQQGHVSSALGRARLEMGDLDAARVALSRARQIDEEIGDLAAAAMETIHLAYLAVRSDDATGARRLLAELGRRPALLDHHMNACSTLFVIGCLASLERQWARCLRAHLAALRHMEAGGVTDSRMRRRQREFDLARARQGLEADAQAAVELEAATGTLRADLDWAMEGLAG